MSEKIQSRDSDQIRTLGGSKAVPAPTELARYQANKWGWIIDNGFGEIQDKDGAPVAGCIEEVADTMSNLGWFTLDQYGQVNGIDHSKVDLELLTEKMKP